MIKVTAQVLSDRWELDVYPEADGMATDAYGVLRVQAGQRVVAVYPSGNWLRAWVAGRERTDAERQDHADADDVA